MRRASPTAGRFTWPFSRQERQTDIWVSSGRRYTCFPPDIAEVRVVEIEGLDLQADGGTHVANTREVGQMRIADPESKDRVNKRIEIALEY